MQDIGTIVMQPDWHRQIGQLGRRIKANAVAKIVREAIILATMEKYVEIVTGTRIGRFSQTQIRGHIGLHLIQQVENDLSTGFKIPGRRVPPDGENSVRLNVEPVGTHQTVIDHVVLRPRDRRGRRHNRDMLTRVSRRSFPAGVS